MNSAVLAETEKTRLAQAWAAAHYFVRIGRQEWLFGLGQIAPDVERQLLAKHYLFITGWNPPPGESSLQANQAANQRLQARVQDFGHDCHPALGCNAMGGAVEPGWLVLDMPTHAADALAMEFGQGGTLYWEATQPVRMRLMWPRPAVASDHPHIDWVG